ncbi:hypothetical protein ACS0TY_005488 [Phlomoides rotata]
MVFNLSIIYFKLIIQVVFSLNLLHVKIKYLSIGIISWIYRFSLSYYISVNHITKLLSCGE